jgi:hypothetical protein
MTQTPSLLGTPREWATDLAVMTAVGVFLGIIGPFGSFNGGGMELRIAYWVANIWIGFILLSIFVRASLAAAIRLDLPIWFALGMGVAIGAVPLAIVSALFSAWFWPPNHGRIGPLFVQYGQVLAIAEPFACVYYFVTDRGWRSAASRARGAAALVSSPPAQLPIASTGDFLDRLPPRLGRELICLRMEDHYVRAHTARGSDLILIPLKDAIAELGATDGLQVHRSWWVARNAVVEPVVTGRNLKLRLSNGLEVPVSRASVSKLRAAGWTDVL